jgi:hypothetical protein
MEETISESIAWGKTVVALAFSPALAAGTADVWLRDERMP